MAPRRTKTPPYDDRDPHPESLAVGQAQVADLMGLKPRQLRKLKAAGFLEWMEQVRAGGGGSPADGCIVSSGTAFGQVHGEEVRQVRIRNLGDRAKKGVRRTAALADLRRGLESSTVLGDGGCGDLSVPNVTFGTVPSDPRPGPSDKAITFQVSGCSFNHQAAATAAHGRAREGASGPGAAPGRRSVGKGNR